MSNIVSIIDFFFGPLHTPDLESLSLFIYINGVDSTGALEEPSYVAFLDNVTGNYEIVSGVSGVFNLWTNEIWFWIPDPLDPSKELRSYVFDGYAWLSMEHRLPFMAGTVNLMHTIFVPVRGPEGQEWFYPEPVVLSTSGWFATIQGLSPE